MNQRLLLLSIIVVASLTIGCGRKKSETADVKPPQVVENPKTAASAPKGVDPSFIQAMTRGAAFLESKANPDGSFGKSGEDGKPVGHVGITAMVVYSAVIGPKALNMSGKPWVQIGRAHV